MGRGPLLDEDGCYDPADFNDGLLLGLKGTMAQAELHFLRARLLGGKLNKAKKVSCDFRFRSYSVTTTWGVSSWIQMKRYEALWP